MLCTHCHDRRPKCAHGVHTRIYPGTCSDCGLFAACFDCYNPEPKRQEKLQAIRQREAYHSTVQVQYPKPRHEAGGGS